MSNRRRERERRRRLAHAETVPRAEREPKPERTPARSARGGGSASSRRKPVPEPSIQRSAKRAALVFVVLFALIYVVDKGKHAIGADALQALLGAAFFVPFDFLLTRIMYRRIGKKLDA